MKNTIIIDTEVTEDGNKLIAPAEAYEELVSSLAAPINELAKVSLQYAQCGLAGVTESLREMMGSYFAAQSSFLARNIIAEPLRTSLLEFGDVLNECHRARVSNVAASMAETLNAVTKDIVSEQIKQLQQIDFSVVLETINPEMSSLSEIVNAVYSMTQEESEENTESFTKEEIQEIIKEQITNSIGPQERFANWSEEKKQKNYIVFIILAFLYSIFIEPYLQQKVGMPVMTYVESNVKELPEKGAEMVCKIKENVEAIIIEDTNYYYKVSFIDENGETREGYVAKRNLKLIEKESKEQSKENTGKE